MKLEAKLHNKDSVRDYIEDDCKGLLRGIPHNVDPFEGLSLRILILIPTKGRAFSNQGSALGICWKRLLRLALSPTA